MLLSHRLSLHFDSASRVKGTPYAFDGRVGRLRFEGDELAAHVQGSWQYTVRVVRRVVNGAWVMETSCDCPVGEDTGGHCKHVWAVVLKADREFERNWGQIPAGVFDVAELEVDPEGKVIVPEVSGPMLAKLSEKREAVVKEPPGMDPRSIVHVAPRLSHSMRNAGGAPIPPVIWVVDLERSRSANTVVLQSIVKPKKKYKGVSLAQSEIARLTDGRDRLIASMLLGSGRRATAAGYGYGFYGEYESDTKSSLWHVNSRMAPALFDQLSETGRLFYRENDRADVLVPLRWSSEELFHVALKLEPVQYRDQYVVKVVVRNAAGEVLAEHPKLAVDGDPGVVLTGGVLQPLSSPGYLSWGSHSALRQPIRVNERNVGDFLTAMERLGVSAPVVWPEKLKVREAESTPVGKLMISEAAGPDGFQVKMRVKYGVTEVNPMDDAAVVATRAVSDGASGEMRVVRRNVVAERELMSRLNGLTTAVWSNGTPLRLVPAKKLQQVISMLLAEKWEVVGEKGAFRTGGRVNIAVSTGIDWFDLEGKVSFGDAEADISDLLEAMRQGSAWVRLGDGSHGLLPEEWLAKHAGWLGLGEGNGKGVRFGRSQLSVIDAMMAVLPEARCDEALEEARRRLRNFEGIGAAKAAPSFRGELRPYQAEGLGWLGFLKDVGLNGCLADDMGLGKTVQVLAHLVGDSVGRKKRVKGQVKAGPTLVVAPKSLVSNWESESGRFAPSLKVYVHAGLGRTKVESELKSADLVLTSYGTMREDIELMTSVRWGCVILDEAQAIKNPDSQTAKAVRLFKADRRLALTGTPVENRLEDLWSIYEFLNPGMLGRSARFGEMLKASRQGGSVAAEDLEMLRRAIRPLLLRRTKAEVAKDLPSRTEQTVACQLGDRQRKLYDGLKKHYRDLLLGEIDRKGIEKSKMNILEALLRLRQAACHPDLIEPPGKLVRAGNDTGSAKFHTLLPMLEEVLREGHKVLLFSQFTTLLDLLTPHLGKLQTGVVRIDGKTSALARKRAVEQFQTDEKTGIFLVSLKAGGVGLNLTAADYVFLLDPWWNPAVEAQAIDRAHRIGQTRPVVAYRMLAEDTVEEKIAALQARKRQLADAIVSGDSGPLSSLTRQDLEYLLE